MVRAAKSVLPVVALAAALGFVVDLALTAPDGMGPGATGDGAGSVPALPAGRPVGALSRQVSLHAPQAGHAGRHERRHKGRARAGRHGRREPGPAGHNRDIGQRMLQRRDWASPAQFRCLDLLWTRESHWNHRAAEPSTGAYGIPQAHPGAKMATAGSDWRSNPRTQIKWGLRYVRERHGGACQAWDHLRTHGWY